MTVDELVTILSAISETHGDCEIKLPRGGLQSVMIVRPHRETAVMTGHPVPDLDDTIHVRFDSTVF